jgi:hypothetical protein
MVNQRSPYAIRPRRWRQRVDRSLPAKVIAQALGCLAVRRLRRRLDHGRRIEAIQQRAQRHNFRAGAGFNQPNADEPRVHHAPQVADPGG